MTSPNLWVFFLQGFHLHTHALQTIVTLLLLVGLVGAIGTMIQTFVKRFIAWHAKFVAAALISKDEWFEHKRLVGTIETTASQAKRESSHAVAEVDNLRLRVGGLDTRLQHLELAPTYSVPQAPPPVPAMPAMIEFRLEVDNIVDEVRENVRLFREEFEQRLMLLEDEPTGEPEVAIEDDPTVINTRPRRKTKKPAKRRR